MEKQLVVNLELIKELRMKKNISIEQMSKLMGYKGYQGYYYKENGTRKMSADDIAKISVLLGVPINALFFEKEIAKSVIFNNKKSEVDK
jgi:transcriptional regulator with XRE-family HTH domain